MAFCRLLLRVAELGKQLVSISCLASNLRAAIAAVPQTDFYSVAKCDFCVLQAERCYRPGVTLITRSLRRSLKSAVSDQGLGCRTMCSDPASRERGNHSNRFPC